MFSRSHADLEHTLATIVDRKTEILATLTPGERPHAATAVALSAHRYFEQLARFLVRRSATRAGNGREGVAGAHAGKRRRDWEGVGGDDGDSDGSRSDVPSRPRRRRRSNSRRDAYDQMRSMMLPSSDSSQDEFDALPQLSRTPSPLRPVNEMLAGAAARSAGCARMPSCRRPGASRRHSSAARGR